MAETHLPNNVEAEQQILGALMLDNDLLSKVVSSLREEHFYDPVHAAIYKTILSLDEAGRKFNPVTLKSALANHPGLQELGGAEYLVIIASRSVASVAIDEYATIVLDEYTRRQVIHISEDACAKARDGEFEASEVAMQLEIAAAKASATSSTRKLTHSHLTAITEALQHTDDARKGKDESTISTGVRQLDEHLSGGFRPGEMIIAAGRPGMCKTTVAQNITLTVAQHGTVFFASMEMPKDQLAARWLSNGLARRGTRIPYQRISAGRISDDEYKQVFGEGKRQISLPIVTAERNVRSIEALRSAARKVQREAADTPLPLKMVAVDYLQLIEARDAKTFHERVSRASDACKSLALELSVPVLALAQLNRGVEMREPPMPTLPDMRDSGKLEEDADVVLMLYREEVYLKRDLERKAREGMDVETRADFEAAIHHARNRIDFLCEKQRSGATGRVTAYISPEICHLYSDWADEEGALI